LNSSVGYKSDIETHKVKASQLMVTGGCSQGLAWICRYFTVPGDTIFVEEATYYLAIELFKRDYKLNIVSVEQDKEGLLVNDKFEELCRLHKPKFIYTVPTHGNPTGKTIPEERRKKLIEVSRKYNFLILADEVYQLINFEQYIPPPPFAALDNEANSTVIAIGSFAKIFAPGLRLGWIQTKNSHYLGELSVSGEIESGGNAGTVTEIGLRLLELGLLKEQLQRYNQIYESRTRKGIEELKKNLKKYQLTFPEINGGYFVWVQLPPGMTGSKLLPICLSNNVRFAPGTFSSPNRDTLDNFVRFCFVYWTFEEIETGIKRFVKAIESI